jgi:hypothetical protein
VTRFLSILLLALQVQGVPRDLYTASAVVTDSKGVPVRDLAASDVSIVAGGATLPIERFEKDERPLRMALVLDSSAPLASGYRLQFVDAASSLIASLPETARVTVWTTGDRPTKVIDDLDLKEEGASKQVSSALRRVAPIGGNTMLDALVEASKELQKAEGGRRVLVFISAEGPGFTTDTREGVVDRVRKSEVEVAGVVVSEQGDGSAGGEVSSQDYDYVFGQITQAGGGRLERALSVMGTGAAMARVAADLRSTYRLSYFHSGGDRRPKIALEVARPSVKVRLSSPRKEISSP